MQLIESLEPRRLLNSAYTVTDLGLDTHSSVGLLSDVAYMDRMAINNGNQVVAGGGAGAFLYSNGKTTPLTSLSRRFRKAYPLTITDAGQILGTFAGPSQSEHIGGFFGGGSISWPTPEAFAYDRRHFRDLGPGQATVVTSSGNAAGLSPAFVFIHGSRHRLKLSAPATGVVATGFDSAGDVIVVADHVYLYRPKNWRAATPIASTQFAFATVVTTGLVTGVVVSGSMAHAYTVGPTQAVDLGSVNLAGFFNPTFHGLNASGESVGEAQLPSNAQVVHEVAVVSHNGLLTDLNMLAPPSETGYTLQAAEAVNDAGSIAAVGTDSSGRLHHLMLSPTP